MSNPSPTQSFDPATVFLEAYKCAKHNINWNKVLSSLLVHPEWLTKIPEGRTWAMLHQIVYAGNIANLNEVLALQRTNKEFRLLCVTSDHQTVHEIAAQRRDIYPQMARCIERLMVLDQMLNRAKGCQWESLRQLIREQPDLVNEKPPYRNYFLGHHLAYIGNLDQFKELSRYCQFNLELVISDNRTINQVAREHNHLAFAEYIEKQNPNLKQMIKIHHNPTASNISMSNKSDTNPVAQMSEKNLQSSITCPITLEILRDPVMAADGFTYEREAILNWFQQSNRSPMTNQPLDNLEIKPNYAIKSVIQILHDANKL